MRLDRYLGGKFVDLLKEVVDHWRWIQDAPFVFFLIDEGKDLVTQSVYATTINTKAIDSNSSKYINAAAFDMFYVVGVVVVRSCSPIG